MAFKPVRVASVGMGWWSDVLADAIKRTDKIEIVSCYTRSEDKRHAFAKKYGCTPASSYEDVLQDKSIEAIINTTDRSRYRRLLAASRTNDRNLRRRKHVAPLQDSIKTDIAFALMQRLDRIQEAEEFFAKNVKESRQSTPAQRLYERIKRTHPDLYHDWFGEEENHR